MRAAEISSQKKLGEDEFNEEEKKREEWRRSPDFYPKSSLIGPYIKRKARSKMTIDFGGK